MPNKTKRQQDGGREESKYNKPPTSKLPSSEANAHISKKRKRPAGPLDDTPRAFARIMSYQKGLKPRSGLDDGERPGKKAKRKPHVAEEGDRNETVQPAPSKTLPPKTNTSLKIRPGERMVDFSARVNQALPVSGLNHKGKKVDGMKERTTKLQRKITRRQDAWRRDEAKRKEKAEEAEDDVSEEEVDYWGAGTEKKSKRRRRLEGPGAGVVDDDPWAKLKEMREKPRGLHDVAKEPPRFTKKPTEKFKSREVPSVEA